MECVLRIRFGYGQIVPWVRRADQAVWRRRGSRSVWIRTPVKLVGHEFAHRASFVVRAGERVPFVLTWAPSQHDDPAPSIDADESLNETSEFWLDWARSALPRAVPGCGGPVADHHQGPHLRADRRHRRRADDVAARGSGGVRNWDYRYCWLRDATIVLEALLRTGYPTRRRPGGAGSAARRSRTGGRPDHVRGGGRAALDRVEPRWLPGYGARPGRDRQRRVRRSSSTCTARSWTPACSARRPGSSSTGTGRLLRQACWVSRAALDRAGRGHLGSAWRRAAHFVHSKVMAWVAFDRADQDGRDRPELHPESALGRWRKVRDEIHAQVCEKGYDRAAEPSPSTTEQPFDAAVLMMAEVGFLPPDDARMISTIHTIMRELTRDGLLLRYSQPEAGPDAHPVDGLPGAEGAFLACSFWMVNALHLIGEQKKPRPCSSGCSRCEAMWGCSARNTIRAITVRSATARRRSATCR